MKYVKGLTKALKDLKRFGQEADDKIEIIVKANALELERNAKAKAPYDLGKLRQSIKAIRKDAKEWEIVANATGLAPYAAYMEFGTGGFVEVPAELSEVASRFRGRTGRKVNISPRPYMYPSLVKQRGIFLGDLNDELNKLTKKYG